MDCTRCKKKFKTEKALNIHVKTCDRPFLETIEDMAGTSEQKNTRLIEIINAQHRLFEKQSNTINDMSKSIDILTQAVDAMTRSNFTLNTINIYIKDDQVFTGDIDPDPKELLSRILERITS